MAMASSPHIPHKTHQISSPSKPTSSKPLQENTLSTDSSPNLKPAKVPTIRARLSQLCQQGRPDLARHLFESIPKPNTVLWNTIIISFICNGMPNEALNFYSRMTNSFSKSDSYTYSSALKACAETKQLKLGKIIHCQVLRSRSSLTRIVSNSLLNMYSNCLNPCFEFLEDDKHEFVKVDLVQRVFGNMRKRNAIAWNSMISWYTKTGRYLEALKLFKTMMNMGIKPTVVSFINVFPAIAGIEDRKSSVVLYGLLLKLGTDYVSDLFAVSSAIFMFSELGDINTARQVFTLSRERNIEIWNTMIGGYVQNGLYDEALEMFLRILELDQIIPDTVTFLTTLTAVSQLQRLDLGQQVHAYLIKNSMVHSVVISNALISLYSRCNYVGVGFGVFDKMLERDVVSWNTMISAFVQNGLDDEGLMLVYGMQKEGILIDSVTATALLSAASNLKNHRIGKETHAYLFRHGIRFEGMDSYLIDMYAKSGLIDTAKRIFENNCIHSRDLVTWNSMIAGYTQNGQTEQAFTALREMIEKNEVPNSVTLSSVLPACNPVGGVSVGKQLHCFSLRHSMDLNVFVGTALLDMYSKCGSINYAERVFNMIQDTNSVTYTTMILGFGQHGLGERALSLFRSMSGSNMKPDAITFVAILSACSYSNLVDEGLEIFESMEREYRIKPTAEHYCCVVDMLGRAGRVVEAYEFAEKLGDEGNLVGIWGTLLGACRIHGELELGQVVSERLFELEEGNRIAGYHVLMSNIYAEEGMWENVDTVRQGMREMGYRKQVGCSWIVVGGVTNYFTSKDQKHPHSEAIYAKLDELAMEIKAAGHRRTISGNVDDMLEV
ncbi:hypothetical protein MKX01_011579 [Papaver californicum]|nr:hypothetical protein MKX01_011579 [Papaver californicum]